MDVNAMADELIKVANELRTSQTKDAQYDLYKARKDIKEIARIQQRVTNMLKNIKQATEDIDGKVELVLDLLKEEKNEAI